MDPVILLSTVDVTHQCEGRGLFPTPSGQSPNAGSFILPVFATRLPELPDPSVLASCFLTLLETTAQAVRSSQLSEQSLPVPDTFLCPGPQRL